MFRKSKQLQSSGKEQTKAQVHPTQLLYQSLFLIISFFTFIFVFSSLCIIARPPQSIASCRLSARHILKKSILQAHLRKTTQILMIYKGRHIFPPLCMPGTLLDCVGLLATTCPSVKPHSPRKMIENFKWKTGG